MYSSVNVTDHKFYKKNIQNVVRAAMLSMTDRTQAAKELRAECVRNREGESIRSRGEKRGKGNDRGKHGGNIWRGR